MIHLAIILCKSEINRSFTYCFRNSQFCFFSFHYKPPVESIIIWRERHAFLSTVCCEIGRFTLHIFPKAQNCKWVTGKSIALPK